MMSKRYLVRLADLEHKGLRGLWTSVVATPMPGGESPLLVNYHRAISTNHPKFHNCIQRRCLYEYLGLARPHLKTNRHLDARQPRNDEGLLAGPSEVDGPQVNYV